MIRKSAFASLLLAAALSAGAQTPMSIVDNIRQGGNITVTQPAALDKLLEKPAVADTDDTDRHTRHTDATASRSGYRVQIFEDNNPRTARSQAEHYHNRVKSEFPHLGSYISFNSPYWRVKVGDFRTRAEAESVMAELRHDMPAIAAYMRVVRDKINSAD